MGKISINVATLFHKYIIQVDTNTTLYELREKIMPNFYGIYVPCYVQLELVTNEIWMRRMDYKRLLPADNHKTIAELKIPDNSKIIAIAVAPGCNCHRKKNGTYDYTDRCKYGIKFCTCPNSNYSYLNSID